jgi:hypothetical protein
VWLLIDGSATSVERRAKVSVGVLFEPKDKERVTNTKLRSFTKIGHLVEKVRSVNAIDNNIWIS